MMNNPPFALIASFLAFTDAENMQKASQNLKISQPALTTHLKAFESYFPYPIFIFQGRRKVLTEFGENIRTVLKKRFDTLNDELKLVSQSAQDPRNVHLHVAGRAEILNFLAPKIDFPGTIHFNPHPSETVAEEIISRKYDIGITYEISKAKDLHAKKFFIYGYSIAIPAHWKIKNLKLSPGLVENLSNLPFVSHRADDQNLQAVFKKYNIQKTPLLKKVLPDWVQLTALVQAGNGWTILPTHFTQGVDNLIVIQVPNHIISEIQFYLIYRKESVSRTWFKEILSQMLKAASEY